MVAPPIAPAPQRVVAAPMSEESIFQGAKQAIRTGATQAKQQPQQQNPPPYINQKDAVEVSWCLVSFLKNECTCLFKKYFFPRTCALVEFYFKQECIPVGCVPSAAVAMSTPAGTGHCVSQHAVGRGVSARGCLPWGVCTEADTPSCGQNDRQV